ncbi:hypothetical protein MLD38_012979 [Melastoma candidum]|uniref:Uncharacterized protein n=1 Tax=Melastoma candidum TaxID=119954 RepID=A0ACB9RGJ9_9MYRT|nr:hypothetical protein MLD38_012979 [Melastoma candidum]
MNSCSFIQSNQDCVSNGRPDSGYLYWRWSPQECELPRFDARRFLGIMRDESLGLVGDSISRNHVQSLLCILSSVEQAGETYHDYEYKSMRWLFPSYNFSLSIVWSPFLMKAAIFEDQHRVSSSEIELHLGQFNANWMRVFLTWDYVVISTGAWYSKYSVYFENDFAIGCHKKGRNVADMGFDYAYRISLRQFIAKNRATGARRATGPHPLTISRMQSGTTAGRVKELNQAERARSN